MREAIDWSLAYTFPGGEPRISWQIASRATFMLLKDPSMLILLKHSLASENNRQKLLSSTPLTARAKCGTRDASRKKTKVWTKTRERERRGSFNRTLNGKRILWNHIHTKTRQNHLPSHKDKALNALIGNHDPGSRHVLDGEPHFSIFSGNAANSARQVISLQRFYCWTKHISTQHRS